MNSEHKFDRFMGFFLKPFETGDGDFKWWFRYIVGGAILGATIWAALTDQLQRDIALWVIAGGVILSLVIMRELGCLLLVLAALWLAWVGIEWASNNASAKPWFIWVGIAIFSYVIFSLSERIDKLQKEVDTLKTQIVWLQNVRTSRPE